MLLSLIRLNRPSWLAALCIAGMIGLLEAAAVGWAPYRNDDLGFTMRVPSYWTNRATGKAVAFTEPGDPADRAAFGVLRSRSEKTIDEAVEEQFEHLGRPKEWIKSPARFGGRRAIKIIENSKADPNIKMVEYYVETASTGYLVVQTAAPHHRWSEVSPVFAKMITSFQFLE